MANLRIIADFLLYLQQKVAKMGCISAKSELSAFDLHHLCTGFRIVYKQTQQNRDYET